MTLYTCMILTVHALYITNVGKEEMLKTAVTQVLPFIQDKKAIIYLDFAKDIDCLAIAFLAHGSISCTNQRSSSLTSLPYTSQTQTDPSNE